MKGKFLPGNFTALVTPMKNGSFCEQDMQSLVERQIKDGIDGLVVMGTTGESPTVTHEEYLRIVQVVCEAAKSRVPIIAGASGNATAKAVELAKDVAAIKGVDALLSVSPYYNKPSQEGLFRHFGAIAEAVEKPIMLYSIPGRCRIQIDVDTCARLYEAYPQICAIKDAGGSSARIGDLSRILGKDYLITGGDDELMLPFMSCGAKGMISVASNLLPKTITQIVQLALNNDFKSAHTIDAKYRPLFHDLFIEPNPVPVKFAMHRAGIISSPEVRLPLCEMSPANEARLIATLEKVGNPCH